MEACLDGIEKAISKISSKIEMCDKSHKKVSTFDNTVNTMKAGGGKS